MDNKELVRAKRKNFLNFIKDNLCGTNHSENLSQKPSDRYCTGFLFPMPNDNFDDISIDDLGFFDDVETELDIDEDKSDIKISRKRHYLPPSSAGFSFYIVGDNIEFRIFASAAKYKLLNKDEKQKNDRKEEWEKSYFDEEDILINLQNSNSELLIFENRAKIIITKRKHKDGYIVTLTIANIQKLENNTDINKFLQNQNELMLFEVNFRCIILLGEIKKYPNANFELLTQEERENEIKYKDIDILAVGHGVSVNWEHKNKNIEIFVDFIPSYEVPNISTQTDDNEVLQFNFLKDMSNFNEIANKLEIFINNYEIWIKNQEKMANQEEDREIAQIMVQRQQIAKQRMQSSLEFLKNDEYAKISFCLMNEAMLNQWIQKNKDVEINSLKWRAFQLGFILLSLKSVVVEDDDFRDTLDLIWFPTGGGKTEAYLGVMLFLFVYRRLKYQNSYYGTTAIMRYTLKLLTAQQFLRANKAILSLELLRLKLKDTINLGDEPFSSGLWIGESSTPNTYNGAYEEFEAENSNDFSRFILTSCPWCESEFNKDNYIITKNSFAFKCTNEKCEFHNKFLPISVIDEDLYKSPPTLLLSTVDKFARFVNVTKEDNLGAFFGFNRNSRPPELIIQDELHLISGALGSIVGLYEAGFDTALKSLGMNAKYIASTATIKNAKEQVKTLFARESEVFPPSGLREDNSYFSKKIPLNEKAGRLYVGYLAPLLEKSKSLLPLASIMLLASKCFFADDEANFDNWYSQIIYHSSLKGVSNNSTLYDSEILYEYRKLLFNYIKNKIEDASKNFTKDKKISTIDDLYKIKDSEIKCIVDRYAKIDFSKEEITSNKGDKNNKETFNRLQKDCFDKDVIDVVLATNMISVGLDVSRLALMVINGQPLTTAEYIQASSRVGRGKIPGIVFVNFYKTQARNISHYENFVAYHSSFYKFVEPTSITPFTKQARDRALHAALIFAIRYSKVDFLENPKMVNFDKEKKTIDILKNRIQKALSEDDDYKTIERDIDNKILEWENFCQKDDVNFCYSSPNDNSSKKLTKNFGEQHGLWETLTSMRNVEESVYIKATNSNQKGNL